MSSYSSSPFGNFISLNKRKIQKTTTYCHYNETLYFLTKIITTLIDQNDLWPQTDNLMKSKRCGHKVAVINDEKRWLENGQNVMTKYWQLKYGQKRGQHLIKKSSHLFSKLAVCGRLDSGQKMSKFWFLRTFTN